MRPDGKPLPSEAREVFAASLLILWRFWVLPYHLLWRDWFTILCLFWIGAALASRWKLWPCVTLGVMVFLLVVYGCSQGPVVVHALGSLR